MGYMGGMFTSIHSHPWNTHLPDPPAAIQQFGQIAVHHWDFHAEPAFSISSAWTAVLASTPWTNPFAPHASPAA